MFTSRGTPSRISGRFGAAAFLSLGYAAFVLVSQVRHYHTFRSDLASIPHLNDERKETVSPKLKETLSGKKIGIEQMSEDAHHDLKDDQTYAFSFARKLGFKDWLGDNTPFIHSALAFHQHDKDKWLVLGRQSPFYREGSTAPKSKFHETKPDNEKHYVLFGQNPETSAFYLTHSHLKFTGAEVKEVISRGEKNICPQPCDMFNSNCYSFSVYSITQLIDVLDKREEKTPGENNQNIKTMAQLLSHACEDNYAQGVCNNPVVKSAVKSTIDILKERGLAKEAQALQEPKKHGR